MQAGSYPEDDAISLGGQQVGDSPIQFDEHARQGRILLLLPDTHGAHAVFVYQDSPSALVVRDAGEVERLMLVEEQERETLGQVVRMLSEGGW